MPPPNKNHDVTGWLERAQDEFRFNQESLQNGPPPPRE